VTEDRNFSSTTSWPPTPAWRLPFEAAEDRNTGLVAAVAALLAWWWPSGATEVATGSGTADRIGRYWRSPSGATEDRNYDDSTLDDINTELTVALQGDRRPGEGTH
jgi:hypothetical protein